LKRAYINYYSKFNIIPNPMLILIKNSNSISISIVIPHPIWNVIPNSIITLSINCLVYTFSSKENILKKWQSRNNEGICTYTCHEQFKKEDCLRKIRQKVEMKMFDN